MSWENRRKKYSNYSRKNAMSLRNVNSSESRANGPTKKKLKRRHSVEEVEVEYENILSHERSNDDKSPLNGEGNHKPKRKKMQTLDSILKLMEPTPDELKFRGEKMSDSNAVNEFRKQFSCTKCKKNFRGLIKQGRQVSCHPLLNVLMCSDCCEYYGNGDFSLDSDNEDKYCRWCGEGGTIYTCSACICGFCQTCIRKHFGKKEVLRIRQEEEWRCFFCNPQPLWNLRLICYLAKKSCKDEEGKNRERKLENGSRKETKRTSKDIKVFLSSLADDTSDDESNDYKAKLKSMIQKEITKYFENGKGKEWNSKAEESESGGDGKEDDDDDGDDAENEENGRLVISYDEKNDSESSTDPKVERLKKLEKLLKSIENQFSFGKEWCSLRLKNIQSTSSTCDVSKTLRKEMAMMRVLYSATSAFAREFRKNMAALEKGPADEGIDDEGEHEEEMARNDGRKGKSSYDSILKFFRFATNEIKAFEEKGIILDDLLDLDVYEDENVLGLRKAKNVDGGKTKGKTEECEISKGEKNEGGSSAAVKSDSEIMDEDDEMSELKRKLKSIEGGGESQGGEEDNKTTTTPEKNENSSPVESSSEEIKGKLSPFNDQELDDIITILRST